MPVLTPKSSERIFDAHVPFAEEAELERSDVTAPDPIVDLLEADMIAHADIITLTQARFQRIP